MRHAADKPGASRWIEPAELRDVLEPLLKEIESLNERIQEYDERMEKIAKEVYPEVSLLQQGEAGAGNADRAGRMS